MNSLAEEFVTLDKENHARMQGAIKTAMSADFKTEDEPKHRLGEVFTKKPLEFFVREKIDPSVLLKTKSGSPEVKVDADETNKELSSEIPRENLDDVSDVVPAEKELEDAQPFVADDQIILSELTADKNADEESYDEEEESRQTEHYDEGFAAGRAAALSELEEQRLENLEVLKAISEKLLSDSVFDFDNVSMKVLDTVNELSSERCGIAIDENPENFLERIAMQIEQIRNLSDERCVFFNEQDLEALRTFEEFDEYFADAKVRSDSELKRGDVVVKVGGVELRDAPFSDYAEGVHNE